VFDYILFTFISVIFLTDVATCVKIYLHSFYVRVYCFLVNIHNMLCMDGKKKSKKRYEFLTGLNVALRNKTVEVHIQSVPRVKVTTSGECSLGQTIPI